MSRVMSAAAVDPATEICGMCLESWSSRRDIRTLPCHHTFCLPCLEENQLLNKQTVCPNCGHDHGNLQLNSLDNVYHGQAQNDEAEINTCGTDGCSHTSTCYCIGCKQQYCANHHKFHDQLISTHEVVEISEFRSREAELASSYCEIHPNHTLILACARCNSMKCELCDDQDQPDERCAENERHTLHSVRRVAGSLIADIRRQLDVSRERKAEMSNKLKDVLHQGDTVDTNLRTMLATIDEMTAEMKAEIDLQADKLKQEVSDYHKELTLQIEAVTNVVNRFADDCSHWSESANEMMRKSRADIIRGFSQLSDRARLILNTECPEFRPVLKTLRRSGKKEKLRFPLSLELNSLPPPSAAQLKSSRQTPGACYTLTHLTTGQLVHAGLYTLTGSDFGVEHHRGTLYSLCEHAGCLYMLEWLEGYKHIHVLNLSTGVCSYSVIKYEDSVQSETCQSGLVVNDQHIFTMCSNTRAVRFFSSTDHSLQYDMKLDCLSGHPWGIAQLPDRSLVVTDLNNGLVCNFAVDRNPTVNWICRDFVELTGISIDTLGNSILVASGPWRQKVVHVFSFSGEKLCTISLPDCANIADISIRGNELAAADNDEGIKLYELIR